MNSLYVWVLPAIIGVALAKAAALVEYQVVLEPLSTKYITIPSVRVRLCKIAAPVTVAPADNGALPQPFAATDVKVEFVTSRTHSHTSPLFVLRAVIVVAPTPTVDCDDTQVVVLAVAAIVKLAQNGFHIAFAPANSVRLPALGFNAISLNS